MDAQEFHLGASAEQVALRNYLGDTIFVDRVPGVVLIGTLSEAELLAYTGLSRTNLYGLREAGRGPSYIKCGARRRYRLADVDSWLQSQEVTSNEGKRRRNGSAKR